MVITVRLARHLFAVWMLCLGLLAGVSARADVPPDGYARWIGALEGSEAHVHGGSIVYDLRFTEGSVTVEKSVGPRMLTQRFEVGEVANGLKLEGDAAGPVAELAGALLERNGK